MFRAHLFSNFAVCIAILALTNACTLYKSDDRDSFNQNALAGAPAKLIAAPLDVAQDTGANACWISTETKSAVDVDEARQTVTIHEGTLLCLFSYQDYKVGSRAQVERNSTRLNEF